MGGGRRTSSPPTWRPVPGRWRGHSFYAWFGEALERAMASIREKALVYARSQKADLPGPLGRLVRDWHIVDSTTVALPRELLEEYPGT